MHLDIVFHCNELHSFLFVTEHLKKLHDGRNSFQKSINKAVASYVSTLLKLSNSPPKNINKTLTFDENNKKSGGKNAKCTTFSQILVIKQVQIEKKIGDFSQKVTKNMVRIGMEGT